MQNHNNYGEWIDFAEQDLAIAKLVFKEALLLKPALFNTQQCAEKAFKGYLVYKKEEYIQPTHDLTILWQNCLTYDKDFEILLSKTIVLNRYLTRARYPLPKPFMINKELFRIAIENAGEILNFVKERIKLIDQNSY